jgi:hypothetical protein
MNALVLAGFTALALGAAIAPDGGSTSMVALDHWAPGSVAARSAQAVATGLKDSGRSDADTSRPQDPYSGAHTGLFTFGQ